MLREDRACSYAVKRPPPPTSLCCTYLLCIAIAIAIHTYAINPVNDINRSSHLHICMVVHLTELGTFYTTLCRWIGLNFWSEYDIISRPILVAYLIFLIRKDRLKIRSTPVTYVGKTAMFEFCSLLVHFPRRIETKKRLF